MPIEAYITLSQLAYDWDVPETLIDEILTARHVRRLAHSNPGEMLFAYNDVKQAVLREWDDRLPEYLRQYLSLLDTPVIIVANEKEKAAPGKGMKTRHAARPTVEVVLNDVPLEPFFTDRRMVTMGNAAAALGIARTTFSENYQQWGIKVNENKIEWRKSLVDLDQMKQAFGDYLNHPDTSLKVVKHYQRHFDAIRSQTMRS